MSAATTTQPITVEEFDRLNLPQDRDWELHDGEVVEVSQPAVVHRRIQKHVMLLLDPLFPQAEVLIEYPFQIGDREQRSADVAIVSKERSEAAGQKGILDGAPELVVEVLSPSNGYQDLKRYRQLCLKNGTELFLVLDPGDRTVEVFTKGGKDATYTAEDNLALVLLGVSTAIPVSQIFLGIT